MLEKMERDMTTTTVQLQAEISIPDLLVGVQQLDSTAFEQFVDQVMLLRAKRRASSLPKDEAELLQQINQGLPEETQVRFAELKSKRQEETLTADEHDELLSIVDKIEERDTERLHALTKLAEIRNLSVRSLLEQLGLTSIANYA